MNIAEVTRGLRRRWYIVIPGLIVAVATAIAAWFVVEPGYERTATQLLLPGARSVPEDGNPFLFLGGLTNAADVLVRAVGSENVLNEIEEQYPGVEIEVTRDGSTAGPVILITVTAPTDDGAAAVIDTLVTRTSDVLEELQTEEGITAANQMTVIPVTVDATSVPQQRDRYLAVALAGIGVAVLVVLLASLVDGLALQRRRRGTSSAAAEDEASSRPDTVAEGGPVREPDGGGTDAPGWAPEPSRKQGRPFVLHPDSDLARASEAAEPLAEAEGGVAAEDSSGSGLERTEATPSR
ncbi:MULTISPECIES: hypothetical protein [Microbacterium]|uniref:hypothetical protein n=1 Tax=Microbacterium TaxID=33882 RepID=UPI00146F64D7|nr:MULTISPECIES: hypothetical protein [Microbacterium]